MDLLLAVEKTRFPQRLQKLWGFEKQGFTTSPCPKTESEEINEQKILLH